MINKNNVVIFYLILYVISSLGCSVKSDNYIVSLVDSPRFIESRTLNIDGFSKRIDIIQTSNVPVKMSRNNGVIFLVYDDLYQPHIKFYNSDLDEIDSINFAKKNNKPIYFHLNPKYVRLTPKLNGIMMGGGGFGAVGLFDINGKLLWNFKPDLIHNPNKMIDADLDNNGITEFYAISGSGLYRLDLEGNIVWKFAGDIRDISIYSNKKDKFESIIVLNSNDTFSLISPQGKKIRSLGFSSKNFSFATMDVDGNSLIVYRSSYDTFRVVNQEGKFLFDYKYKNLPIYHGPYTTSVSFDGATYVAILMTSRSAIQKSVISIFSLKGELVYQAILNYGSKLAAQYIHKTDNQRLLVSDGNKISVIEGR